MTNGSPKQDKIIEALFTIDEALERCQIPYVVLGTTAYEMKNDLPISGEKIVLGVLKQHAVPSQTSLIPLLIRDTEILTDGWKVKIAGVSITIHIVPKKYPTLMDPDQVAYSNWYWKLPNPFNAYWEGYDHYDH